MNYIQLFVSWDLRSKVLVLFRKEKDAEKKNIIISCNNINYLNFDKCLFYDINYRNHADSKR